MKWDRRKKVLWRIPLAAMVLVTLFWGIWYAIAGSVPETSVIQLGSDWMLQLPFIISRWWDIPCTGLIALVLTAIFTSPKIRQCDSLLVGLIYIAIIGLFASMMVGLLDGLSVGLSAILLINLATGLSFGLLCGFGVGLDEEGLIYRMVAGLICGLIAGLTVVLSVGLGYGLIFGLATGLVCGLISGLAATLAIGLKFIFSQTPWRAIGRGLKYAGRWLIAK